jgi:hypothetical protein
VRINLAQRFDREFPPHDTYADVAAFDKLKDRHLSKKQIIQSLIGRHVGPVLDLWTFDSPKEFVTFKILSFTKLGDLRTDYEVQTRVKGIPSGEERNLKLHLTYGWVYTRWILVEVRQFE